MSGAETLRAIALKEARRLLEASLFDARFYRSQAELADDVDAFAHYFEQGWKSGLAPNVVFDSNWYLAQNPDVAKAGINPLLHYAFAGEAAGFDPSPLFDVEWYKRAHQTTTPLAHYLNNRLGSFSPIPEFDAAFYLGAYPDVAEARLDPFQHYMQFGYREYRKPAADFNPRLYANRWLQHDRGANPILDLRARRRSGKRPEPARPNASSFDYVKQFARAGVRYEPRQFAEQPSTPTTLALAFYLPQFHRIAENDAWWGEGFTEWTQLARGTPRFAGHYQPRIPGALGFYDLSNAEAMREQARLARAASLSGFVFYAYDFDGVRLLDRPLENFVRQADIEIDFCLMWANENWTRRWDGAESEILIEQRYEASGEARRAAEFARYFRDPRYIRLEGRPLLMVYRASLIPDTAATIARWRRLFKEAHNEEPLFVMAQCFDDVDPRPLGFDAAVEFPPHKLTRGLPEIYDQLDIFDESFEAHVYAYDDLVAASLTETKPDFPLLKTAVPSWDNDARRQGQGLTLAGSTPLKYERWLAELVARAQPWRGRAIVCINAWNEWSEGAYLEPDVHFGWAYLNATARALLGASRDRDAIAVIGKPAPPALMALAHRFAAGFGFQIKYSEHEPPSGCLAAFVAANAAGALPKCSAAGLKSVLLIDGSTEASPRLFADADAIVFADHDARRRTLGATPTPANTLDLGDGPEPEASARKLFDLALPSVAKISAFVINQGCDHVETRFASLVAQSHPIVEILIFDLASTDASFDAIDAAARAADRDATVVIEDFEASDRLGLLRRAAEIATGDYLFIADARGRSDPELLRRLVAPLQADARVGLSFCDSRAAVAPAAPLGRSPRWAPPIDRVFEAGEFVSRHLDRLALSDLSVVLWRRRSLLEALAAKDLPSEDWTGVLSSLDATPQARVAYVADALDFALETTPQESLASPTIARMPARLHWSRHRDAIVDAIAGAPGDLKIVMKLRNEVGHLKRWWEWHAAVYGAERLILFDNDSDDPSTLSLLEEIAAHSLVARFSNRCDDLHDVAVFSDLYWALRASSRYFCLIDADERLCFVSGDRVLRGHDEIASTIGSLSADAILCPWFDALPGSQHTLHFTDPLEYLRWGKPLLASARGVQGFINHNAQYLAANGDAAFGGGVFVAHYRWLWPRERVRGNVDKLIRLAGYADERQVMAAASDPAARAQAPASVRDMLQDIDWLGNAVIPTDADAWRTGCLRLTEDGALQFHDEDTRRRFHAMLDPRSELFRAFLGQPDQLST